MKRSILKCPGQDMQNWTIDDIFEIPCSNCGKLVEFFRDDLSRKCDKCSQFLVNKKLDLGCAQHCEFAEKCIEEDDMKKHLKEMMENYFGEDTKRINHALQVTSLVERISLREKGDLLVNLACGYLHDIGIPTALKKYNSHRPTYQEREGAIVARTMLSQLKLEEEIINEVCDIIGHHHHPRETETLNYKILYDADLIVNTEDRVNGNTLDGLKAKDMLNKRLFTKTAKLIANELFLKGE